MFITYFLGVHGERDFFVLYTDLGLSAMYALVVGACSVFGRSFVGWLVGLLARVTRGPSLGLRRWNTSLDTKEVFERLRPSL